MTVNVDGVTAAAAPAPDEDAVLLDALIEARQRALKRARVPHP